MDSEHGGAGPEFARCALRTVGTLMARHWGPVFAPALLPRLAALRPFLAMCSKLPADETIEPLGFADVAEVRRHTKSYSPGLDGLPYEVWTVRGAASACIICDLYSYVVRGGALPAAFNESL